jgi:hypothetical protein
MIVSFILLPLLETCCWESDPDKLPPSCLESDSYHAIETFYFIFSRNLWKYWIIIITILIVSIFNIV